HPMTPYTGRELDGVVRATFLRGEPTDGNAARGQLLRPEAFSGCGIAHSRGDIEMRLIVVNVNTSQTMTKSIDDAARRYASVGTEVVALQPYFGAEAVDCNFESYLSAVAVMDRVLAYDEPYDAVVLAGFGEHGRDGLAELV